MDVRLTESQVAELRGLVNSRDAPAAVATRARIVAAEGKRRKDIAEWAGLHWVWLTPDL